VTELADLADREGIRAVALRYCRGIDRLDAELVRSAYWPEATDDHGTFVGPAHEFAGYAVERLGAGFVATMHTIFNHSIELDEDRRGASGEIYNVSYHLRDEGGVRTVFTWWGRYLDRYEKRGGEWRIIDRVCVHEWTSANPIDAPMPIASERFRQGGFDRNTAS